MQRQSMNLLEFQNRFPSEEACRDHLFKLRWPDDFSCPRCGHNRYYPVSTRRLYECAACRHQTSLTSDTVFHKTRTPLRKWFWMIFMMTRQKPGVSMLGMQRLLEIKSYKTVWTMGHKIRKAMADRDSAYKLGGLVEMNDAFIGKGTGKRGHGSKDKPKVIVAVESRDEHAGFACIRHVPAVNGTEILRMAREKVEPGSRVRTAGRGKYRVLAENAYDHDEVESSHGKNLLRHLAWVYRTTANLKSGIVGIYHGVGVKHLHRYLSEFCFRFNRRFWESQLFDRTVVACAAAATITFSELKG